MHHLRRVKVAVIIPAHNEEQAIGKVLNDIPRLVDEIVVADNASTDRTAEVAKFAGATVVHEPRMGYGYACLKAMQHLANAPANELPDIVVFMDGDYADDPKQLPQLIAPIAQSKAKMVIGSRVLGNLSKGALTPQQRFGNALAVRLIKTFFRASFTDLGPFRAIDWHTLQMLNMQDKTYGWTVEMQIKAAKNQVPFTEIPVNYRKRIGKSKVSGTLKGTILAGYKILYTIKKYA